MNTQEEIQKVQQVLSRMKNNNESKTYALEFYLDSLLEDLN